MCFSAEASFIAGTVILTTGVIAMKKSVNVPQRVFALIPLFFALQQYIEGFLWIGLQNPVLYPYTQWFIYGFLFFAWIVWPVFVPLSCMLLEKKRARKLLLSFFILIGLLVASACVFVMFSFTVSAGVQDFHIKYATVFRSSYTWLFGILYLIPTIGSLFVSGVRKMWILGVINLVSYVASKIFFQGYVISVWCFFGAVASVMVVYLIVQLSKSTSEVEDSANEEIPA